MSKLLLSILLASAVATPAVAGPRDNSDREQARVDRSAAREERQQARSDSRESNAPRTERAAPPEAPRGGGDFVRPEASGGGNYARPDTPRGGGANFDAYRAQRDAAMQQRQQFRDQRVEQRDAAAEQRQQLRDDRNAQRDSWRETRVRPGVPVVSNTPAPHTQPPPPTRSRYTAAPNWSTSWRNNNRYDWHNYRNRHRSLFHLGFYYDPFGWGYQRYSIGWRLWPSYFSSSFWINDPWQYRLPYAPPGTRWVRYYDDALLVDMWSGQVVDVIYDFFW